MCDKCADNRELCEQISERINTAERVREYYRRQGEERERERIITRLKEYSWAGYLEVAIKDLISDIEGETNGSR